MTSVLSATSLLRLWTARLGLGGWDARLKWVHPLQVTTENGLPATELVGVIIEPELRFTIVHTRPLEVDDIVHELLHVLKPEWRHDEVELWTARLVLEPGLSSQLVAQTPLKTIGQLSVSNKEIPMPQEYKAFNLRTRKECTILEPEVITMRNGRKAVQGIASDDKKTKVFRILGKKEAEGLSATS
jgi:hypothetical protein